MIFGGCSLLASFKIFISASSSDNSDSDAFFSKTKILNYTINVILCHLWLSRCTSNINSYFWYIYCYRCNKICIYYPSIFLHQPFLNRHSDVYISLALRLQVDQLLVFCSTPSNHLVKSPSLLIRRHIQHILVKKKMII